MMASNSTQLSTCLVFDLFEERKKEWHTHTCTVNVILEEFSTKKAAQSFVDAYIPMRNFGIEHGDSRLIVRVYSVLTTAESGSVSPEEICLGFMISLESTQRSLRVPVDITSRLFNQDDQFLGGRGFWTDTLFFGEAGDDKHKSPLLPLMLHEEMLKNPLFVGDFVRVQFRVSFDIEAVSDEPAPVRLCSPSDALALTLWNQCTSLISGEDAGDFQLVASDGRTFGVHKYMLSLRSDVFKAMFRSNCKEAQTGKCEIEDVDRSTLKALIRFCYGVDYWKPELAEKLLVVADKYRIDDLRKACIVELIPKISFRNTVRLLKLADLHSIEDLKSKILEFIVGDLEGFRLAGCWSELREANALYDLVKKAIEARRESKKQATH